MGCHFLLQGIFQTQGLNPGLQHCRQTLYPRSPMFTISGFQICKCTYSLKFIWNSKINTCGHDTALKILSCLLDLQRFPDEASRSLPSISALLQRPEDEASRGQCGVAKEALVLRSPGQGLNLSSGTCHGSVSGKSLNTSEPHGFL